MQMSSSTYILHKINFNIAKIFLVNLGNWNSLYINVREALTSKTVDKGM